MKEYRETRTISASELRNVCIAHDYYTNGTNDEYYALLEKADKCANLTTSKIVEIVKDIMKHSDIEKLCYIFGCGIDELFESIAFNVVNACHTFIEKG